METVIFLFDIMCIGSLILSFQRCVVLPSTFKLVKMTVYHLGTLFVLLGDQDVGKLGGEEGG